MSSTAAPLAAVQRQTRRTCRRAGTRLHRSTASLSSDLCFGYACNAILSSSASRLARLADGGLACVFPTSLVPGGGRWRDACGPKPRGVQLETHAPRSQAPVERHLRSATAPAKPATLPSGWACKPASSHAQVQPRRPLLVPHCFRKTTSPAPLREPTKQPRSARRRRARAKHRPTRPRLQHAPLVGRRKASRRLRHFVRSARGRVRPDYA